MKFVRSEMPVEIGHVGDEWRSHLPSHAAISGLVETRGPGFTTVGALAHHQAGIFGRNGEQDLRGTNAYTGLMGLLEVIDEHYRITRNIPVGTELQHSLEVRTGIACGLTFRDLFLNSIPPASWSGRTRYLRRSAVHLGGIEYAPAFTVASAPTTDWYDGIYVSHDGLMNKPLADAKLVLFNIIATNMIAKFNAACHAEEDVLLEFDESTSAHGMPVIKFWKHPNRAFLRDIVTVLPDVT